MNRKLALTTLVLILVLNMSFAQSCTYSSVMTIAAYDPGDCGRINDKTRDIPDIKDLVEVMDNTKAYDLGTGFVYELGNKKYILTCEHLLFKTGKIVAYDAFYNSYPLKLVGTDMFYDLAVLEFECQEKAKKFKGVVFDNADPDHGLVLSAGYWKWNGQPNLERGEILKEESTKNNNDLPREIYLKSSAHTSGGFSGGPLFNKEGKVIGMNNSIHVKEKVSYALKGVIIEKIALNIIANDGYVVRPFCGLEFSQNVTNGPVVIDEIIEDSPATKYKEALKNQPVASINN